MKKRYWQILASILALILSQIACGSPITPTPTTTPTATADNTPTPPPATATPSPMWTPSATPTATIGAAGDDRGEP